MKKLLILALTLALTTTCTTAKTVAKPKLKLSSNYLTEDNKPQNNELQVPVPCLVKHERTDRSCTIRIEWDAVSGAKSYDVQRSIYSDFREHEDTVTKTTKNTYYQCSTSGQAPYYFPAKQTYYLRVRAVAEDGNASDWSGAVVARGSYTLE